MLAQRDPPYPPPPRLAPAPLGRDRDRVSAGRIGGFVATLLGVLLFLAAPFVLAAGAVACLLSSETWLIVRVAGFIVLSVLALVYLKSLLPRRLPVPPATIPVLAEDQPTAYAFLGRVAADIGAPAPRRLLIGSGAELSVGGTRSVLDLARRGSWDLTVGLWLWHALTLSEFQALVARTLAPLSREGFDRVEFTARALLHALTDGLARLDELAQEDGPLAGLARAVGTAHLGLTLPLRIAGRLLLRWDGNRGQVFADDLVAVRIAGSDALVHAVLRADFAGAALREVDEAMSLAARDRVITRDVYDHFRDGAVLVREAHNDFTLGEPPTLRGPTAGKYADVFEPGRRYLSDVWAGMPTGDAREQNAKRVFVAAELDDRPATNLLDGPGRLAEHLSHLRHVEVMSTGPDTIPLPPDVVRHWLSARRGPALPARYAGAYDGGRRIDPGTPAERDAAVAAEPWDDARLLSAATGLYAHAGERATAWRRARGILDQLLAKTLYEPTGRTRALAEDLEDDLRKAGRWLAALDRWVYVVHVHMAARLPDLGLHDELLRRYESVLRFQSLAADAREYRNRVAAYVRKLAAHPGPVPYRLGRDATREFAASRNDLNAFLAEAGAIDDPLLQAWTGDAPLSGFLYSHERRPDRGASELEEFGRVVLTAWDEVAAKARWLHRLGVAELLRLQERILGEFTATVRARGIAVASGDTVLEVMELEPLPEVIDLNPLDPDRPGGAADPLNPGA